MKKEREGGAAISQWLTEQVIASRAVIDSWTATPILGYVGTIAKSDDDEVEKTPGKLTESRLTIFACVDTHDVNEVLASARQDLASVSEASMMSKITHAERMAVKWTERFDLLSRTVFSNKATPRAARPVIEELTEAVWIAQRIQKRDTYPNDPDRLAFLVLKLLGPGNL